MGRQAHQPARSDTYTKNHGGLWFAAGFFSSIDRAIYQDNFGGKCYFIGDESFEAEYFVEAYYFHGAMLEKRNNSLYVRNHFSG